MLLARASEVRKCVAFISLTKPREKAEAVLKLMECLFMQTYITLLIHFAKKKKVPK